MSGCWEKFLWWWWVAQQKRVTPSPFDFWLWTWIVTTLLKIHQIRKNIYKISLDEEGFWTYWETKLMGADDEPQQWNKVFPRILSYFVFITFLALIISDRLIRYIHPVSWYLNWKNVFRHSLKPMNVVGNNRFKKSLSFKTLLGKLFKYIIPLLK